MDYLIKVDCRRASISVPIPLKDYLNRHIAFRKNIANKVRYDENGIINFDELLSANFPSIEECDVFISYSHKDLPIAINLANRIEKETKHKCFIDELYWASIRDIRDNLNNIKKVGLPSYSIVTERDEWAILGFSAQLLKIISQCDYFIFIETQNSINKNGDICDRTSSPWLFFENRCANELYNPPIHHSNESWQFISPKIIPSYKLDLSKYIKMTIDEIISNLKNPLF